MQKEKLSREEFLTMFREDVIRLSRYIPWFEDKCGNDVSQNYTDGDLMDHTLSFPVYDSILLAFLNDASTTVFMEQNYHYFYSRNHIQNYEDELRLIETADIMHMDVLQCILSRYVFGGMTKAYLWRDGVEHRVFLAVLKKARQIIEFWSQPLIIEDEISPDGEIMGSESEPQAEDDGFSDEFIAQIMAEYEAEDAAKAAAEAEASEEETADTEALIDEVEIPVEEEVSEEENVEVEESAETVEVAESQETEELPVEEDIMQEVDELTVEEEIVSE